VGAKLIYTDRQTGMTKLTGAFCDCVHSLTLKMDRKEIQWIWQDHNRKKCQAKVNTANPVTSLLCTIMWEISSLSEKLVAFQEFSSMELVTRMLSSGM